MSISMILLRLDKESPNKCSLTPLRERSELPIRWIHARLEVVHEVGEVTLLHPDGELLGTADAVRPLLLVDCSWRDLPRVLRRVHGDLHPRRLPEGLRTAYPRRSKIFTDPAAGLASVEALHAAQCLLGRRDDSLLDGYRWREDWLSRNAGLLAP